MSTRKLIRAIQSATAQIFQAARSLTRGLAHWLLRGLLLLGRQPRLGRAGFVLPTTILVILVVLLTVGSIVFRTYTRTTETISERQQRVIFNAATPAIDRARAKLEFLFDPEREPRYPGGVPSENTLMGLMMNGATIGTAVIPPFPGTTDPYTFTDETRINVGTSYVGEAANGPDNAWRYRADTDGDGNADATVVYGVAMRLDDAASLTNTTAGRLTNRAQNLRVRNTPLSTVSQGNPLCQGGGTVQPQQGWVPEDGNSSTLLKNFQVNAYVLPDREGLPVSTLEMQLDRQLDRGNKWGAWFRYDLEIFPGRPFNWNGAMHTEGSLMMAGNEFRGYMISDPDSCLYTKDASEISIATYDATPSRSAFRGEFIGGGMRNNTLDTGTGRFDLWNGAGQLPTINQQFGRDADSIPNTLLPADYALDPVVMQTQGISAHRNPTVATVARPATWDGSNFEQDRMVTPTTQVPVPYVDDTFRADNRYGPKPTVGQDQAPIPGTIGGTIPSSEIGLVGNDPGAGEDSSNVGLDGYWERRARIEGMRLIVGQRLELGDPAGWGGPVLSASVPTDNLRREALKPFDQCRDFNNNTANVQNTNRCNEARQRRGLWDNLAAVQSMAVYHSASGNLDAPVACMASTIHPGTAGTLDRSATFQNLALGLDTSSFAAGSNYTSATKPVISDFLRGRGTNGWEYQFNNTWLTAYDNPNSTVRIALDNLAHFAGDPRGGAPSFEPVQDRNVHPFPSLAMWGDQSVLRRVLAEIEAGTSYANLSPADKTTLHTATCTLGMLAYNLDYLEKFKPEQVPPAIMGTAYATRAAEVAARAGEPATYYVGIRGAVRALINGTSPLGAIPIVQYGAATPPVFPTATIDAATGSGGNSSYAGGGVFDTDGASRVNQPETYVRLLERWRDEVQSGTPGTILNGGGNNPTVQQLNNYISITQLVISKEQVARDRYWGFFGDTDVALRTDTLSNGALSGLYGPTNTVRGCQGMRNAGVGDSLRYLCSWRPRYPSLFSLFPSPGFGGTTASSHGDVDTSTADEGSRFVRDVTESTDPAYSYLRQVNVGFAYRVIPVASMDDLVSLPRTTQASWNIPAQTLAAAPANNTPSNSLDTLIKVCFNNATAANQVCLADSRGIAAAAGEQFWRVPFKDSAFFNGREMLNVRTTDVNLGYMRTATKSLTADTWLPKSGIVYAYREDGVSEPHIIRPRNISVAWTNCNTEPLLRTSANCQMLTNRSALSSQDPPLPPNGVSVKPVDYYSDPDRRPNGFRLRNGSFLGRTDDEGRGISFISDNAIYIQGNFNLHNSDTNPAEEFTQPAGAAFENFYARNTLNGNFARATTDSWRPTEVLADAITILSDNFCDGSVQDSFLTAGNGTPTLADANLPLQVSMGRYGCVNANGTRSSYLNQDRPSTAVNSPFTATPNPAPTWRWTRTNVADGLGFGNTGTGAAPNYNFTEGESPIYVSPSGNPWRAVNSPTTEAIYNGQYYALTDGKPLMNARAQRVNSIIVSGLVPSQARQSYGGMHNFPRFIENWDGNDLFISGSLVQLNFSTSATGPFDQDAWEVGNTPQGAESIRYYGAPNRRWGYDVGLQYAPAGPVAQRFIQLQPTRNEFYSEPPANDPYMQALVTGVCASGATPLPPQCP